MNYRFISMLLLSIIFQSSLSYAGDELADLSLEELLDVEITSLSKKAERKMEAAGAVYVITSEDIRRSTATNVPDLLRTVPGISVARLDSNKWAITARGFSGRYANKLLVLIDGRSLYTTDFAGVIWEAHPVLLDNVDRIEIIRGPGATVWGANAVNGVINIVTKSSTETQGGMLNTRVGTEERFQTSLRYGGTAGAEDGFAYRFFGTYEDRDSGRLSGRIPGRLDANDDWDFSRLGFRFDWALDDEDTLSLSGDYVDLAEGQTVATAVFYPPYTRNIENTVDLTNQTLQLNWTRNSLNGGGFQLNALTNLITVDDSTVTESRDLTFNIDFQQTLPIGERSELNWGLGLHHVSDSFDGTRWVSYNPEERNLRVYSAFLQNEFRFLDERLRLTIGSKFEYNDFTGLEVQPSARVAYAPSDIQTFWASVSRAVRTPSRSEDDVLILDQTLPGRIGLALVGSRDYDSETLLAFEAGYRRRIGDKISVETAAFYNIYDDLRSIEVILPRPRLFPFPPYLQIPAEARNNHEATTYGLELNMDWRPYSWWRIRAGYSYLEVDLDLNAKTLDIISGDSEGDSPEQQFFMTHSFNLPKNLELDATLRYTDSLPTLDVDDYLTLDMRFAWQPNDALELSISGQNLLQPRHTEFQPAFVNSLATQVERGVYGEITWRF